MNDRQPTISRLVWETRYRAEGEADLDATRYRVARALASVEPAERVMGAARYLDLLKGFRFLPGGRILAGIPFASFERLYRRAYDLGLKGCTTFRPNPVTGEILSRDLEACTPEESGPCCGSEREEG
ncbi:hypothetical protein [Thiocapsa sp.]|uniref:hypothetical protein n=1 Tax=Thiocapsa sp. TaxID=2024551 RepID=UPI0025D80D02|nr:hypothetical protein [Thiocapsa sp.]